MELKNTQEFGELSVGDNFITASSVENDPAHDLLVCKKIKERKSDVPGSNKRYNAEILICGALPTLCFFKREERVKRLRM